MKAEYLTRQESLIPVAKLGVPITIVGNGAVGGWTALALAKMGFLNMRLFDFDTVDDENMNSQFFRIHDIGKNKAEALAGLIYDFTGVRVEHSPKRYEGGVAPGVLIMAVDSMIARKAISTDAFSHRSADLIIDPRMGAETALMYAINPKSKQEQENYEKSLYSDSDAVQEPCTAKATVYCATMLSGLVARTVKGFAVDGVYPKTVQWDIKGDAFQAWRTERADR